jgi:riboflavin synthase
MYSGITQGLYPVTAVEKKPGLTHYRIALSPELMHGLKIGASINIDGVCQSVIGIQSNEVSFDAMAETLRLTTLNELFVGRRVSVERSLCYGDEIGGHEVAGHVIGTAVLFQKTATAHNLSLTLQCPSEWMKYILSKGFIAVDGSSLTVGAVDSKGFFDIHLIPETLRVTNFGNKKIGDKFNIELDHQTQTIVTTVERYLATQSPPNHITLKSK